MEWTVKHFEMFLNETHHDNVKSPICGFNQWIDNHYAYDGARGQGAYLDVFAAQFEKFGLPYRWWAGGPGHVIYGVDPTGWAVQFDGQA